MKNWIGQQPIRARDFSGFRAGKKIKIGVCICRTLDVSALNENLILWIVYRRPTVDVDIIEKLYSQTLFSLMPLLCRSAVILFTSVKY